MRQIKIKLKTFRDNRVGQSLTEYAIILAVFVILLLGAIPNFEDRLGNAYLNSEGKVVDIPPSPNPS